jgi:predicted nucleotidyltransferase
MIVLFGSYANGHPMPGSDVDLLVVVPDEVGAEELVRRRTQLVAGLHPRVDLVPATRAELSESRGERASFLRGVLEHGIALHGVLPNTTRR